MSAETPLTAAMVPPQSLTLREPVWGVDPSTRRIAVGMLAPGVMPGWRTLSLEQGQTNSARLWKAACALPPWFEQLRDDDVFGRPRLVVVEQPFASGKYVPHESLHMLGVLLGSLWGALGLGTEVLMLGPSEWKSRALGKGRGFAKKPEILQWAREACGYGGALEDEADALAIATAGGVLLGLRAA